MLDFVQKRPWHYYKDPKNLQSTFKLKITISRV